jgi:hypothetical protein
MHIYTHNQSKCRKGLAFREKVCMYKTHYQSKSHAGDYQNRFLLPLKRKTIKKKSTLESKMEHCLYKTMLPVSFGGPQRSQSMKFQCGVTLKFT